MNHITKVQASSLTPSRLPVALDNAIIIARNAMIDGEIPERSAPSPAEMQALADRVQSIRGYLAPARPEEIAGMVGRLFMGLARRTEATDDEAERAMLYVEVLSSAPRVGVEKACHNFLYGRRGDGKWVPTAAEIYKEAMAQCAPWFAAIERINAILNASIIASNEYGQRARNLAHMKETLAMLRKAEPEKHGDGLTTQQRAEKWLDEQIAAPKSAPLIGEGLRKWLDSEAKK